MLHYLPKNIPISSGVYFFLDESKTPIYIGKASNLRNRLRSYAYDNQNERIHEMVNMARSIIWQETDSEIEALILESQLIKKHHPRFNIMLRDDKQYFYVVFTDDMYPRIFVDHRPDSTHYEKCIGPFTSGNAIKTTLKLLRKIFPYCTCRQTHHKACLNYHIHNCPGFCCLKKNDSTDKQRKEYKQNIHAIEAILLGKKNNILKKLNTEMLINGKAGNFEHALILRDKIKKLETVFSNAKILKDLASREHVNALKQLQKLLGLQEAPRRIEGYDIAHIQGSYCSGGMVVFEDGIPNKKEYRKFKIANFRKPNDTGMLAEMLTRRLKHTDWPRPDLVVIDGGKAQFSVAEQILKVLNIDIPIIALTKNEKHKGKYIILAPDKSHKIIAIEDLDEACTNLILEVDAEAHRFAISYYKKLHRTNLKPQHTSTKRPLF